MAQWQVVVVEPDRAIAQAHVRALQAQSSFRVVGVAASAAQGARLCQTLRPHLVLVDVDGQGLALLRRLRMTGDAVEAIAVTSRTDAATVRAAMQVGVVDYV